MIQISQGRGCIPDLYDLAHVAAWELYNLHDLGNVSCVDLYGTDPAQDITTAG